MERLFVCANRHSFKLLDEGEEPAANSPEFQFGVTCPQCGSITKTPRWTTRLLASIMHVAVI